MNKKVIIILINLLISMALIFIFANPLWDSVKVLRIETNNKNQDISNTEQLLIKIEKLESEYQEIAEENIQDITLALPKEKDLPYLINQFEILSLNNGLLFESLKFGEEIERDKENIDQSKEIISPFSYLPVQIVLSGSYEGLKSYLNNIEDNIRLMDVVRINFENNQISEDINLSGSSIFKFTLELIIYYQQ